ncbi:uncharacterized protein E0L32_004105 [Thyridium curvatum]|uniref:Rhodopsin domain-containing protein n=1 Tax=Thyridium curvatum TaxID=1093900 RepID=A0A507BHS0_9PEZI|nr:uncharacterized protein E0L32_004105 [Thyridium curvatum]TPX16110.1 hypothetical protein E0L32_004105 [Thyridium curvatum]
MSHNPGPSRRIPANSYPPLRKGVQHYKLGQMIGQLPQPQIDYYQEKLNQMTWTSEFFYSWSIFLTKMAVLAFYWRMFKRLPIRWPIIILACSCVIWIIIRTFMTIFRCSPIQYYWHKSINGHCSIDAATYYVATDSTHTALDVLILTLPVSEVVRMKLPLGQKISVVGLFSCGLIVCIASAFQIVQSRQYNPQSIEVPHQLALSLTWAAVELNLAVLASCLPLLRPIFRKFIPGLSTGDSSGTSRPSVAFGPSSGPRVVPSYLMSDELFDESLPHLGSVQEHPTVSLPDSNGASLTGPATDHRERRILGMQDPQGIHLPPRSF